MGQIEDYKTRVLNQISNQDDENSISPDAMGRKLIQLADILKSMIQLGQVVDQGFAAPDFNPGIPTGPELYRVQTGATYANFPRADGNPIVVPTEVDGRAVIDATIYWDLTHWSLVFDSVILPVGPKGWSPVLSGVNDGLRIVKRLIDYVGGAGSKPTENINQYVGPSGYVTNIADAINFRGGAGDTGLSAYQAAVAGGYNGTQSQWIASLQGPQGTPGTANFAAWGPNSYGVNSQVSRNGNDYVADGAAGPSDIPGVSSIWRDRLTGKANLQIGKNKFNRNRLNGGGFGFYINWSTGVMTANPIEYPDNWATGFIEIKPNTSYFFSTKNQIAWYDSSRTFISGNNVQSGVGLAVTSPANAFFVRATVGDNSAGLGTWAVFQVEEGTVKTAYEAYSAKIPQSEFDVAVAKTITSSNTTVPVTGAAVNDALYIKADLVVGKNKFNRLDSSIIDGWFLNASGALVANALYFISGYIPVDPSVQYILSNFGIGGAYCVMYDENKVVNGNFQTNAFTPHGSVRYVRLSGQLANKTTQQMELGSVTTSYEAYKKTLPAAQFEIPLEQVVSNGNTTKAVTGYAVAQSLLGKLSAVIGKNKLNLNDPNILLDRFINATGAFQTTLPEYLLTVSGYIPISSGQSLKYNYAVSNTYAALYDANGVYVAGSAVNANVITWQTGASFARFTYKRDLAGLQIELGAVSTSYLPYTEYGFNEGILQFLPDKEVVTVLPKKMYFVMNKQFVLYYENVLFKNLIESATIYINKGLSYSRLNSLKFTAAAVAQTILLQVVKNFKKGELKTITYDVIDPAVNNGKTIDALHVGDSFTDIGTWVKELKVLFNAAGVAYNFIGTNGDTTYRAEGLSGGTLANTFLDATAGVARIITVTGLVAIPNTSYPGVLYRDANNKTWLVRGGKVDGSGNGKLRITNFGALESDFTGFPASGVLTKVTSSQTGDATITYSNPVPAYHNVFLNHNTGFLDLPFYISFWGLSAPKIVAFQFTWNDTSIWASDSSLQTLINKFKTAADHVHTSYPNAKVIFSIEPMGSFYGNLDWNGKKYTVLRLTQLLLTTFEDDANYNTWLKIAPSYAGVDLINGYSANVVVPSDRFPAANEISGGDGVHPSTVGMQQIADVIYPVMQYLLTLI